ncbi:hypothetical protein QR680_015043 [Steinernema hermaphroditum]|uniref:Uncharacterized protein n=1 Tax=Steinernema hermaphroditum TaxID=289476 RepID=A0AA39IDJ7_9BILA|nr:hypothetical protein QR680_015043 [Steinernema hermaphroditum]
MKWLLFPVRLPTHCMLAINDSCTKRILILDPGNSPNDVVDKKIKAIINVSTGRQYNTERLQVIKSPTDEKSALFVSYFVNVFLNSPSWITECGVQHELDVKNFKNEIFWHLKPFVNGTADKIVDYTRKRTALQFSKEPLRAVDPDATQRDQICIHCPFIHGGHHSFDMLQHYHNFHDKYYVSSLFMSS